MAGVDHLLNRVLAVYREQTTADGYGGQAVAYDEVGSVAARVSRASAAERQVATREGAEVTHDVYLRADADVRRGDFLVGDGQMLEVLAVTEPSSGTYRKADTRQDVPAWALPMVAP